MGRRASSFAPTGSFHVRRKNEIPASRPLLVRLQPRASRFFRLSTSSSLGDAHSNNSSLPVLPPALPS